MRPGLLYVHFHESYHHHDPDYYHAVTTGTTLMVKTFGWVLRPCGSAGGAFGSTMLLHPHRTHGQGFWMGLPARRTYANRPPRRRYAWSRLLDGSADPSKSLDHAYDEGTTRSSSMVLTACFAWQMRVCWGGFCEYHAATTGSTLIVRMVKAFGWVHRTAGLTKKGGGTFGAVLTRLLDGSCGLQDLRKPGAARGPRSRYGWSSAKFLVHKQGRQGVQWHVLAKATHFNGGDAGVDHHCAPGSDSMVGFSAISD